MPPKRRAGRPKKRKPGFAKWKKDRQEAAKAAREAEKAIQDSQPSGAPLDPPPAASTQAKARPISSCFGSIERQAAVPSPQLGPASRNTASKSPGDAVQGKGLFAYAKSRGRVKGDKRNTLKGDNLLPASRVHFLHGEHPPHVLFCAERACGARCFCNFPAPRAQGPPEQGARNYKEEQQDKTKGRRGTTTKAGAAAQSWELGAEQQEHQLSTQHAARQLGNCACTCACQGPPLKTEPFQSHLAKATRRLSSQF